MRAKIGSNATKKHHSLFHSFFNSFEPRFIETQHDSSSTTLKHRKRQRLQTLALASQPGPPFLPFSYSSTGSLISIV